MLLRCFVKKGLLLIILAGVMWGTSCVFVNIFEPYSFGSVKITAFRLAFAFLGMLIYCLIFKRHSFKVNPRELLYFFICGAMMFATAAFYYESMRLTSASTSVVLMYISPVPIMLLSVLTLGEKFNARKGVAVGLMLIGCALVAGIIGDFKPNPLGIAMGLLSAASYTVYNLFNKIAARKSADPFSASLYTYLFAALFALLLSKPWEIPALLGQNPGFLIPMFMLHSLVTCLFPYLLYTISLKYISVGVASALSIIEPMTGALLGFIVYGDKVTAPTVLGIIAVVTSVFLLGVSEMELKPRAKKQDSSLENQK